MRNFLQQSGKLFKKILDLLFPFECIGCKKDGNLICENCLEKIENNIDSSFSNKYFKKVYTIANWNQEIVQSAISKLKFRYAKNVVDDLELFFKLSLKKVRLPKNSILVPVPLHKIRKNFRGFNQSEILAYSFGKILDMPIRNNLIFRTINTYPQSKLKGFKRRNNLKNAFKINFKELEKLEKDTPICLIDDIASTMTTLSECALQFKRAGYNNIYAIVFARGK